MRPLTSLLLLFISLALQAQVSDCPGCSNYNRFMQAGQGFMTAKEYDKALIEFQSAQVAARACKCSTEAPATQISAAIKGIQTQREDALKVAYEAARQKKKAQENEKRAKAAEA
ncbi:MAG: hypothetical protein KDC44_20975, partial [Phaeodactylibacter sp.]|nr:hypothetical protein [Phaeodactylibacter sp.]